MQPLIETLPPPQRLALAYASRRLREPVLGLLALDAHLAGLVRRAREPILGQMRLAWWRERLQEPATRRPAGDPLLDLLAAWDGHEAGLVALAAGWEHLLSEALSAAAIAEFAEGRGAAFAGLAALAGEGEAGPSANAAGRRWALADLAAHLSDGAERDRALAAATSAGSRPVPLPRALRPLAILDGLARRSLARGGAPLAAGPGSGLAALRLGIVGR